MTTTTATPKIATQEDLENGHWLYCQAIQYEDTGPYFEKHVRILSVSPALAPLLTSGFSSSSTKLN